MARPKGKGRGFYAKRKREYKESKREINEYIKELQSSAAKQRAMQRLPPLKDYRHRDYGSTEFTRTMDWIRAEMRQNKMLQKKERNKEFRRTMREIYGRERTRTGEAYKYDAEGSLFREKIVESRPKITRRQLAEIYETMNRMRESRDEPYFSGAFDAAVWVMGNKLRQGEESMTAAIRRVHQAEERKAFQRMREGERIAKERGFLPWWMDVDKF